MVKKKKKSKLWPFGKKKSKKAKVKKVVERKKVKKTRKKAVKKVIKRSRSRGKGEKFEVAFEEVVIKCPSCGREFRIVKSAGFSPEGMLCQRCSAGGGVGLEGGDDF